ncbi:ABC transporter permease [Paracoccus onubensis]|uniref:ABC transporter permease n=1 Tax=Paracoccus onubensis TaxID=1675788 RepID=A0A418SXX7_9RHOB|nr:ABC transporter permease [Paracoccus onubensis]RJE85819.1 ABC transporter permease [Paracoccus onubensis]
MTFARIKALFSIQLAETKRDFGAVFLSLIFPLFFVLLLSGSVLLSPDFKVEFGIVNAGTNTEAREFADQLASQNVALRSLDAETAREGLDNGELSAVVIFPDGWTANGDAPLQLETGKTFAGFAETAIDAARARIGLPEDTAIEARTIEQARNAEFNFIYPGMLALALVQLGLFMTATPILKARDRGTLRYLLLTPLTKPEMVFSQIAFRVAVAVLQIGILLAVGSFIVELSPLQWLQTAGVALMGVIMLISLGYALSGLATSTEAGMAMVMIANFTLMFGGNIFWDPEGSTILMVIAHILPVSYLADAFRQIISGSEGLWPLWLDLAAIIGWTVAILLVATRTFSFDMRGGELRAQHG